MDISVREIQEEGAEGTAGSAGLSHIKPSKARCSDHPSSKPGPNPRLGRGWDRVQRMWQVRQQWWLHQKVHKQGQIRLVHEIIQQYFSYMNKSPEGILSPLCQVYFITQG